jgi:DNA polymerase III delta subunit
MAKIDLNALSIEELAALRDSAIEKLAEKVAARRAELDAELEKLSLYDKPAKKSQAVAPVVKAKKSDEKKSDEVEAPVAQAA